MSLSGGDEKEVQVKIKETLKKDYPNLSKHYFVGSDTHSALASALPNGAYRNILNSTYLLSVASTIFGFVSPLPPNILVSELDKTLI